MIEWKTDENNELFLETGENRFVYKEDFRRVFGNTESYDELIIHQNATETWKETFYHWKGQGLLN